MNTRFQPSRTSLLLILSILGACGGGGGSSKSTGPQGTSGPHTLGGTVTGLVGNGVTLGLTGSMDIVDVTSNGTFTFPSTIDTGAAFDVVVLTQPTAPAETCTVAHGTATMGRFDVTDVAVTCAGDLALVSGFYARSGFGARTDRCMLFPSDVAMAAAPFSLTADAGGPGTIDLVAGEHSTLAYAAPLTGTATGASFTVQSTDSFDMAAMMEIPPYDCMMAVTRTITGTVTATGKAHATMTASVTGASGTQCTAAGAAYVTFLGGTGGFPCDSTETLDYTFDHPFPAPLVTQVDLASESGAVLQDQTNPTPATGTGILNGQYENVPFTIPDATSICYAPGAFPSYVVVIQNVDYSVQIEIDPARWGATSTSVGSGVGVSIQRRSDGATMLATSGTVTQGGIVPSGVGDPTPCDVSATNVAF